MTQRKRRRLIIAPRFQCAQLSSILITLLLATGAYTAILAWVFYEFVALGDAIQLTHNHYYYEALADIKGMVLTLLAPVVLGTLLLAVYGGLLRTRRIIGPIHSFMRHLNALARGADPESLRFRQDDCFGELAEEFNSFREAEHGNVRRPR